ncbi:MAG: hypothetical protein HWE27_02885 [Gammaproteobacteria bacterium]|nr:hypothetical protein [Gammaproteobacteria bacterium]
MEHFSAKILFWIVFSLQAITAICTAFFWPDNQLLWLASVFIYIGACLMMFRYGSTVARLKKLYYLFTVIAVYFNWFLFGSLGSLLSYWTEQGLA